LENVQRAVAPRHATVLAVTSVTHRGAAVSVFVLSDRHDCAWHGGRQLTAALSAAGQPVLVEDCELDLPGAPAFGHQLAARWAGDRPDVAIAHGWLAGLAAQVAGQATDVPVITRFGPLSSAQHDPDRARLEAAIARGSALVLAGSSAQAEQFAALGVPRRQVLVVPVGVDTTTFTDTGPAWPRDRGHRLVAADDLSSSDALGAVVAALPALPTCELLVISPQTTDLAKHPVARELVAAAARHRVADRLRFVGPVEEPELPQLLRSADVAVDVGDGQDASFVLRAMACGVPVVAYDAGAVSDAVADTVTGLLVPSRSPSRLGDAVRSLLTDGLARESYGMSATDRARARFGRDVIAVTTTRAVEDVLAARWAADEAS
jgi:D-inositol-3-phosphate glycosyltransferase